METFQIFPFILTYIAFILNFYVIYLICFASPKSIKRYKYYLLSVAILDNFYVFFMSFLLVPVALLPLTGSLIEGPAAGFGEKVARWLFLLWTLLCGDVLLAVTTCIIFRYTTVFADPKYQDFLSEKRGIFVIVCVVLIADCGFAACCWLTYTPPDEYLNYLSVTPGGDAVLERISQGAVAVGFGTDPIGRPMRPLYAYVLCWMTLIFVIDVFCVWQVHRYARYATHLTNKGRRLQLQFLMALVIQAFYPFVTLLIPLALAIILKRFIPDAFTVNLSKVCSTCVSFHSQTIFGLFFTNWPLMNSLSTIICVKPYRVYTMLLLSRLVPKTFRRIVTRFHEKRVSSLRVTSSGGLFSASSH